ncbi:protein crumbs-like isoform X3 [Biomphalaria glabrata]|nr:protein crumbs-like isoform X3 [Biomphalaria glabrata]
MWKWYYTRFKPHSTMQSLMKITKDRPPVLTLVLGLVFFLPVASSQKNSAFFNTTSLISIPNSEWDLSQGSKTFIFTTCSDSGYLIAIQSNSSSSQSSSSYTQGLALLMLNKSVAFQWTINGQSNSVKVGNNMSDNIWYTTVLENSNGALKLSISTRYNIVSEVTVANSSINSYLLNVRLNGTLKIGEGFTGCMYQGPGVNFSSAGYKEQGIVWDQCQLELKSGCIDVDQNDCWDSPCLYGGTCIDLFRNFTCQCPANYNGTRCENDLAKLYGCQVNPCLNGGTCHNLSTPASFNCTCPPGYNGLTCENRIDFCRLTPCLNGGICVSGNNSYSCNCSQTGYAGTNCSVNINECSMNTSICGAYGTCYDAPGSYTCSCQPGFEGKPCQNVDDCLSQPCQHGGTCEDAINAFICRCPSGFSGSTCDTNIDDCVNNNCSGHNSTCKDLVNGFQCICKEGYTGVYPACTDTDECSLQFCQNSATCLNSPGSYNCSCPAGYTDHNCSTNIDDCASKPCHNATNCTDLVNGYRCHCLPGYTGTNCDVDVIDCLPGICLNNATCQDLVNGYRCVCQPGFNGINCSTNIDDCASKPCLNGAQCVDLINSYACNCTAGYEGVNCGTEINKCRLYSNPCQNNGTCWYTPNDYHCNCTSDWMGKNCTEPYDACQSLQPCQNGGNCSSTKLSHNYTCSCVTGFDGKNCEHDIDDCIGITCPGNRTCNDKVNNHTCDCPIGFTGSNCETVIDMCETHPCQNGGTCTSGRSNYTCNCIERFIDIPLPDGTRKSFKTGYTGVNCEIDIDECNYSVPICQNGGLCQNTPKGSFSCFCKTNVSGGEMYVGTLCEQLRTYCDIRLPNETCQNGGTCINLPMSSTCACVAGYEGKYCETNIDDCSPNPCLYNGTCTDLVNNHSCTCIDGITGYNCQTNIDDCSPSPCLNNGVCHDRINNYTCDCSGTGFIGSICENNFDDCASNPCHNGGNCTDRVKNYTCECYKGYTGDNCQIDIQECTPNPCRNNSLCLENSNVTLYDKGNPKFVNFTYDKAAGYICECVPGLTGVNCSIDVDECQSNPCLHSSTCIDLFNNFSCKCSPGYQGKECDVDINECNVKPCQNGGTCIDKIADYLCICKPPVANTVNYGGRNCSTLMTGCNSNSCSKGDCIPKLDYSSGVEIHGFSCSCYPGYTGEYCNVETSMSFVSPVNYVKVDLNTSSLEISLTFRTASWSDLALVVLKLQSEDTVSIQIIAGEVMLTYKDIGIVNETLKTLAKVNDSNSHSLLLKLTVSNMTLSLPNDKCAGDNPNTVQPCIKSISLKLARSNITSLVVGNGTSAKAFVGCVEDLRINSQLYYPALNNGNYVNVTPGCSRSPQCSSLSCNSRGSCEDLWNKYSCLCNRPYYGQDCQLEYPAATFFPGSYVSYSFPPEPVGDVYISFFLVTRQNDGFIMMTTDGYNAQIKKFAYLALYMKNSQLSGDFFKCGSNLNFVVNKNLADGKWHFISIVVKNTSFTIFSSSDEKLYENLNISQSCSSGFGLSTSKLFFGQFRNVQLRTKRHAHSSQHTKEISMVSLQRVKRQTDIIANISATYSIIPDWEGVIQDIHINGKMLDFDSVSESIMSVNVTVGANSTRNVCPDSPCQNGGTCSESFYNDFSCQCLRGYTGKNCSELNFCSYGTCPSETTCVNIPLGYECIGDAAFLYDNSGIQYVMNGSTPEPSLTFNFRTRGLFGLIFILRYGEYFFKVRVANGVLEINSKLSSEFSESAETRAGRRVDDGRWYSARFEIINETHVVLEVRYDKQLYDSTGIRLINSSSVDIGDMLMKGEIILGSVLREKYSKTWEANFKGCLREVRMGGVLMPFYFDDTFENNTVPVKFMAKSISGIVHHCTGDNVCSKTSCLNGGSCVDIWNSFTCKCPTGFYGDYCESNPDNCGSTQCMNGGLCLDGYDTSSCMCPLGYTNNFCQDTVNMCEHNECANSSACVNRSYDYICNCSGTQFTGWFCNVTIQQNCSQSLCQNGGTCTDTIVTINNQSLSSFNCSCRAGYEGPLCEKPVDYCNKDGYKCFNNGKCINNPEYQNYTCNCDNATDFIGPNCSTKVNNCYTNNSCVNGKCIDGINNYTCQCPLGYEGLGCEHQVNMCGNSSFCQRGSCVTNGSCDCTGTGYGGPYCQQEIDECSATVSVCLNGANCTNLEGDYNCSCTEGYTGKNCQTPSCTGIICQNDGTCNIVGSYWQCTCKPYIEGKYCDKIGPCFNNPCRNQATCQQSIEYNNYTCFCLPGWRGENCSEDIDECNETIHACWNGTCHNTMGGYNCFCDAGYTGQRCESDINECLSNPCKNGGICSDMVNNYTCMCNQGYQGQDCSQDIDECALNTSLCNKGTCANTEPFYHCNCGTDYLGDHCQLVNPCANVTCLNQGTCQFKNNTSSDFTYVCTCSEGYEGSLCEKSASSKDTDLGIIIGPIVGGIVFIIIVIVVIAFIMTARSKRATRGAYSPSQQETSGSRVELGNVLKKPPEERLI